MTNLIKAAKYFEYCEIPCSIDGTKLFIDFENNNTFYNVEISKKEIKHRAALYDELVKNDKIN